MLPDVSAIVPQSQLGAVDQDQTARLAPENEESLVEDNAVPEKKSETQNDLVQSVNAQGMQQGTNWFYKITQKTDTLTLGGQSNNRTMCYLTF